MPKRTYDVVIVGGSVAGCIAALCYAQSGLSVVVLERKRAPTDYKALCTHFVQPIAYPTLVRLGLDRRLEVHGAIPTKAAFWTPAGWIDPPGAYSSRFSQTSGHAYNIERRILDPLLRAELEHFPNIELRMAHRVTAVTHTGLLWRVEAAASSTDELAIVEGRLLVAADGRGSRVATLLENPTVSHENQRVAYFSYFTGIPRPKADRSLFLMENSEMGFLYPLNENRTLLAAYIKKAGHGGSVGRLGTIDELIAFFSQFRDLPDLSGASSSHPVLGYVDYPNLARSPVWKGAAFCGDAALSLDPMSGVGCGFAIVSAELLADSTAQALRNGGQLDAALSAYESEFNKLFPPHAQGIRADSLVAKSMEAMRRSYARIAADADLQQEFIALTGRLVTPSQFQAAYLGGLKRSLSNRAASKAEQATTAS